MDVNRDFFSKKIDSISNLILRIGRKLNEKKYFVRNKLTNCQFKERGGQSECF